MKKLGFGMMRLATLDPKDASAVNIPLACQLVDAFLDRGFTYFDTAYFYSEGKNELAVREALVRRHQRSSFLLADKMPLARLKDASPQEQAAIFDEQLEKCGVDYFDRYLLHCITRETYATAQRLDTFAFLAQKKAEGKLRRLGFSFHDKADLLDQVLTEHPEVEFVQLQINYLDWEDERIQARKCYETAVRHGKQVVVMEPVKGGRLAQLPEEAAALLRAAHPHWSPAVWALRFAAGLPQVELVLSGMNAMEQVLDNTAALDDPAPLTAEELALLAQAAEIISRQPAVACTNCRYCVDGCPRAIAIPDYFALFNAEQPLLRRGDAPRRDLYLDIEGGKPDACVACRQCEIACPQHLPIIDSLRRVANLYRG